MVYGDDSSSISWIYFQSVLDWQMLRLGCGALTDHFQLT